ncbi:condensation domain-containing protein, partial [Streptomyces jumonjinensis]|uniref:condensation domain-containing protein n=1 Tax=Streptomyces jumonjinensis TaxID=1945 RepID=UPI002B2149F7
MGLDFAVLTDAVQALVDHHDALRARLEDAPKPRLVVPEPGELRASALLRRVDATGLEGDELRALVGEQMASAVGRLDPYAGVMVQVVWFDRGSAVSGRLLIVVDHLVVDGVSWRVLLPDLAGAYAGLAGGRGAGLDPVPTSFRHWARELAAEAGGEERLA